MCGLVVLTPSVESILCSFLVAICLRRSSLCCGVRSLEKITFLNSKRTFEGMYLALSRINFCAPFPSILFSMDEFSTYLLKFGTQVPLSKPSFI